MAQRPEDITIPPERLALYGTTDPRLATSPDFLGADWAKRRADFPLRGTLPEDPNSPAVRLAEDDQLVMNFHATASRR